MSEEKTKKTSTAAVEDKYSLQELIAASKSVFGVPSECAVAAFTGIKKAEMTVSEAKAVIEKFMKKEVK